MKKNKKSTVDKHFAERCVQRLGYVPDVGVLVQKIIKNELLFLDRQSNRVTRWLWKDPVRGVDCILPYDKERKQVITVLFKDIEDRKISKS